MHRTTRNGIALVALVGTFATSLWAYSLIGPIWSGTTTPYWINTSNRDGLSDSALETAVRSGADVWNSTNQNTYFDATYAGPTSRSTVTLNNYNDVFFRNGRSGNAIATTYTWYIGSEIVEADIAFWDKKWRFFTGTSDCSGGFYVEDIITHEMGHFYGLGHSGDVNATMYPSASYCSQEFRSLDSDDVDGIEALYGEPGTSDPPPDFPTMLTPTVTEAPAVQLQWTNVDGEDRYIIERSIINENAYVGWGITDADDTSFTDTQVNYETTYWYRVIAEGPTGSLSMPSAGVSATIGSDPTPDPPPARRINLLVAPKNKGRVRIQLSWSGATTGSVDIHRDGDLLTTTSNDGSYTDRAVSAGNTYMYKVCEANGLTVCSGSLPGTLAP